VLSVQEQLKLLRTRQVALQEKLNREQNALKSFNDSAKEMKQHK